MEGEVTVIFAAGCSSADPLWNETGSRACACWLLNACRNTHGNTHTHAHSEIERQFSCLAAGGALPLLFWMDPDQKNPEQYSVFSAAEVPDCKHTLARSCSGIKYQCYLHKSTNSCTQVCHDQSQYWISIRELTFLEWSKSPTRCQWSF